jgi:hypothetical protein
LFHLTFDKGSLADRPVCQILIAWVPGMNAIASDTRRECCGQGPRFLNLVEQFGEIAILISRTEKSALMARRAGWE